MENASAKLDDLIAAFPQPVQDHAREWVEAYREDGWAYADIYRKLAEIIGKVIKEKGH